MFHHMLRRLGHIFASSHEEGGAVDPRFQVMLMVISNVVLAVVFFYPVYRYSSYEKLPILSSVGSPLLQETHPIKVGLHVENFLESDLIKNNFGFEGVVWFTYPVDFCTQDLIEQFCIDQGTITQKKLLSHTVHGATATACYTVQGTFRVPMDFRGFPLDDHTLYITLKHDSLAQHNCYLATDTACFTLSERARINNCVIEGHNAYAGYTALALAEGWQGTPIVNLTSYQACFEFNCRRQDLRHFANLWLPLVLIFFLSIFAFSFAPAQHGTDVPAIAAAGVPAILAYRFVIESLSPDVNYFMLSDYLFFLFLFLCLLVFYGVSWGYNQPVAVKKVLIMGLYAIMVIGSAILVWLMNW